MNDLIRSLWSDESGQDLVEYVLILVLIALAATAALTILGSSVNEAFDAAASNVQTQTGT